MKNRLDFRFIRDLLGYGIIAITVILLLIRQYYTEQMMGILNMRFRNNNVYFNLLITILTILSTIIIIKIFRRDISRNKELEERKNQYECVVNNIKEIVFQTDANGLWTFLNPSWTEVTGYSLQESLGYNFLDFVYGEDRQKSAEFFPAFINGNKEYCRHERRYKKKDGEAVWVEVYSRLIYDENGNVAGTSGTLNDIDERKKMENELYIRDRILQGVVEAANVLFCESDAVKGFSLALEKLGKCADVDRVYIFENHPHPETGESAISQRFEWCRGDADLQIENPELQNITYEALGTMWSYHVLSKGGVIKSTVRELPKSEQTFYISKGIVSLLVVPIMLEDHFYGFIGFDDCQKDRQWTKAEESSLLVAAASIGALIKRRQMEIELQKALKNDFKRTVKNLQNLVFKLRRKENGELYITLFEGKLTERFVENTESVYGKSVRDILPDTAAAEAERQLAYAFDGKTCSYELEVCNHVYFNTVSPVIEGGRVVEVIGSSIDITDNKNAQEHIKYLAYYDTLTGLPNRTLFKDRLNMALSHEKRNNQLLSVMFLDLDRFKYINDTLGHTVGDLLLKEVAARLKQTVKEFDTVARMGGDEFTLILADIEHENHIMHIADKVIGVFDEPFYISEHELYINVSIGISIYPNDGDKYEALVKNADIAMYRAKEYGGNNYQFYTEALNEKLAERLKIENSLRKSLERDELVLQYQSMLEPSTGNIVGCEALIRWNRPGFGLVSPADFIPLAEETGLIVPIGEWVLKTACKQLKMLHDTGHAAFRMAVNISAQQFEQQDFIETVDSVLKETGVDPYCLEVEITESVLMKSTEWTINIFNQLKARGIKISIDDFGTGFSSLGYLQRFSADILKIDRSFIQNIPESPRDEAIVTEIINMAHILGLAVIAEGVEMPEQLSFLKSANCDIIQGYYISRPIYSDELEKYYKGLCSAGISL